MNKYNRGFTLFELVIVIGIIGLLAAVIIVFLGDAKNRGGDTAKIQAVSDTRKALQSYAVDFGGFPATINELGGKYIGSVDINIIYKGTDGTGINTCTLTPCPSYHLAIPLQGRDNKVLAYDNNLITYDGNGNIIINGTKDNCIDGNNSVPSLCYDVTP